METEQKSNLMKYIAFSVGIASLGIFYFFNILNFKTNLNNFLDCVFCCRKCRKKSKINTLQNSATLISNCRNLLILPKPEGNGGMQGMQDKKFYIEQNNFSIVNEILEYNSEKKEFENVSYKFCPVIGDNIDKKAIYM